MSKKARLLIVMLFCLIPAFAMATWQIATRQDPARNVYTMIVKKGSLKKNVVRYCDHYRRTLKWKAPITYRVFLNTKIEGRNFQKVLNQLLDNYDLKVTYQHKTVTVAPSA